MSRYDGYANQHGGAPQRSDLRFIVARHGERLDVAYGDSWYNQVFGNVERAPKERYANPVLPQPLPYRSKTYLYNIDPPLTRKGQIQAMMKGRQLSTIIPAIDYCYSSPACRCILTASAILQGMGRSNVPIRPEPTLFEPLAWNPQFQKLGDESPFLSVSDWKRAGYRVDRNYPHAIEYLDARESEFDFYDRSSMLFQKLESEHGWEAAAGGYGYRNPRPTTVLLIGHAATPVIFSTIARQRPFDINKVAQACGSIQFLDTFILERDARTYTWTVTPIK